MLRKGSAKEIIKDYVLACKQNKIYFEQVLLFGSVADEKSKSDSDIDVALVSKQFTGNSLSDWKMLGPINIKFSMIDPHPFNTSYFKKGDPFIDEIKRTGIEIH